ncbi:MAG: TPM domain-containing protein, partial [Clostridiales bacterium]|nr:TPM domain-containing protein [Clostridiales bacterium]
FVVLTSRNLQENKDPESAADDFYDTGGFGLDEEHSGCLFYLNMAGGEGNRAYHLSTTGMMIDYFTDERLNRTLNDCSIHLRSGRYAAAAATALAQAEGYVRAGIPEGQYRYDVLTGRRLTARHKALTAAEMLVSALIALVAGFCYVAIVKRGYRLKGSTYRYAYKTNSALVLTDSDDTYLRSTTTRTPRSSSGGGGGGGRGSGVHTGSSGQSHGGGGGRF